ncbi:MAG: hypothetical protein Q9164_002338 [Protoblastenia rupestris]
MPPVTELATLPLQTGAEIENPNSPAGKVWTATLDTVSQQPGYQRAYYGRELENPSLLQLFVDWDTYEAHQDFQNDRTYAPFVKHLMTIVDGEIEMRHANFEPHPPSAAVSGTTSPVTEVLTMYLEKKDEGFSKKVGQLGEVVLSKADGCRAVSSGWVIEEVEHECLGKGKKGNACVMVIGWESKEKHMEFKETQDFKDNIQLIRSDEVKGTEMHHTSFSEK